ncbi:triacylglycerol lipase OBL1-like [Andrographis paniculata]|uniref:triacylglycerol lipase OBL1-like n=1 Tax=Andrographis paniculata TaxID=175694 RepID=UPI0021E8F3E8|nr:triacylglycerol lipase OBL1-like [Andrographis paniculata]
MASSGNSCNKSFCSDYFLVKPEEAGWVDILRLLFWSDVGRRKFVESPAAAQPRREPLSRRWLVFVSVVAMKLLHAIAGPLSGFGSAVEFWLNLLSLNGGFFTLILNFFRGKVVQPDRASASFVSFIGNMDKRLDLEKSRLFGHGEGDKAYFAYLSIMAAKLSYENHNFIRTTVNDVWNMKLIGSYDFWNDYQQKSTTQAFIFHDNLGTVVVAFRGTETFNSDDWSTDVDISWYEVPGLGRIHAGFMKALGLQRNHGWPRRQAAAKPETAYYAVRDLLKDLLQKNDKARLVVTGHSLGGALAALFPAVLALHEEAAVLERLEGVYTYGQPRVGDGAFGEFMEGVMTTYGFRHYRFVYSFDLVPRLPYDDSLMMFKHFGTCVYYNSFYQGKVVAEEPNKNYFSIFWLIPKFLNACWELIRSFTFPLYTGNFEYTESGLIRILRAAGLLVAGLPAHCPPDYVNSISLGSSDVFNSMVSQEAMKSQ